MAKHSFTTDWGGARTNGRMRYRIGGKFAKMPSLECEVCPECRGIVFKEVNPVYTQGFVNPLSMKPRYPDNCHRCGYNLRDGMPSLQQADEYAIEWVINNHLSQTD